VSANSATADEASPGMSRCDPEFHYKFGIDLFVAGVEAVAVTLTSP
jgi:hypothetical protein